MRRLVSKSALEVFDMEPAKIYDFDPRNLPQDLLAAIGLMTACAAQT
jgi:hypothetical protein